MMVWILCLLCCLGAAHSMVLMLVLSACQARRPHMDGSQRRRPPPLALVGDEGPDAIQLSGRRGAPDPDPPAQPVAKKGRHGARSTRWIGTFNSRRDGGSGDPSALEEEEEMPSSPSEEKDSAGGVVGPERVAGNSLPLHILRSRTPNNLQ